MKTTLSLCAPKSDRSGRRKGGVQREESRRARRDFSNGACYDGIMVVNPAARLPISTRKSLDTFYGLPYLTNPNFLSVSFAATRHASLGSARTPGR